MLGHVDEADANAARISLLTKVLQRIAKQYLQPQGVAVAQHGGILVDTFGVDARLPEYLQQLATATAEVQGRDPRMPLGHRSDEGKIDRQAPLDFLACPA